MPSASCRVQAHLKGSVASGPGTGLLRGPPPSGDLPSRPPRPPHVLEHPAPRLTRCAAKTPLPPEAAVWDPPDPPRCNSWAATAGRAGVTTPALHAPLETGGPWRASVSPRRGADTQITGRGAMQLLGSRPFPVTPLNHSDARTQPRSGFPVGAERRGPCRRRRCERPRSAPWVRGEGPRRALSSTRPDGRPGAGLLGLCSPAPARLWAPLPARPAPQPGLGPSP